MAFQFVSTTSNREMTKYLVGDVGDIDFNAAYYFVFTPLIGDDALRIKLNPKDRIEITRSGLRVIKGAVNFKFKKV